MSPSAVALPPAEAIATKNTLADGINGNAVSSVLHRSLKKVPPQIVSANGTHVTFANGQKMWDTTCGAGVSCLGNNNERVKKAIIEQLDKFAYVNSMFFGHPVGEALATELINGTEGKMSKAYVLCSGRIPWFSALVNSFN